MCGTSCSVTFKIWADSFKQFRIYGGLNLGGAFSPKFSAPPSVETICWMQKRFWRCKSGKDILYHHAMFGGAETWCFLGNFIFACNAFNDKVVNATSSSRRRWTRSIETVLIPLDRGRFVVVHSDSTSLYGSSKMMKLKIV